MKRNMDLIREILLRIESYPEPRGRIDLNIDGYSPKEISYHVKLLSEAGLIEATPLQTLNLFEWHAHSLTWEGHEFLEASRDDKIWNKAKELVLDKTGTLPFEVLKQILIGIIQKAIFS